MLARRACLSFRPSKDIPGSIPNSPSKPTKSTAALRIVGASGLAERHGARGPSPRHGIGGARTSPAMRRTLPRLVRAPVALRGHAFTRSSCTARGPIGRHPSRFAHSGSPIWRSLPRTGHASSRTRASLVRDACVSHVECVRGSWGRVRLTCGMRAWLVGTRASLMWNACVARGDACVSHVECVRHSRRMRASHMWNACITRAGCVRLSYAMRSPLAQDARASHRSCVRGSCRMIASLIAMGASLVGMRACMI
jgi:hypothetical protein